MILFDSNGRLAGFKVFYGSRGRFKVIGERNSTFSKDLVLISFSNIYSKEGISVNANVRLFIPLFHLTSKPTYGYISLLESSSGVSTDCHRFESHPSQNFLLAPFNLC